MSVFKEFQRFFGIRRFLAMVSQNWFRLDASQRWPLVSQRRR